MSTVPGGDNLLLATDRTGRYQIGVRVFWDAEGVYRQHLIRWRDGAAELGPRLDTIGAEFLAVSPSGIAVGFRENDGRRQAAAYAYGQVIGLASPADGVATTAVAVNAAGEVAGGVVNDGSEMERVLVWTPDGRVSSRATPAGFEYAQATDIDEDGTVLGVATDDLIDNTGSQVVAWLPDGTPRVLPDLPSDPPGSRSWPIDIKNGKVYAVKESASGWELMEWTPASADPPLILPDHGIDGVYVQAVNSRGSVLTAREEGLVLLQDGVARPMPAEARSTVRHPLTDDDVVYGGTDGARPAYFDCR